MIRSLSYSIRFLEEWWSRTNKKELVLDLYQLENRDTGIHGKYGAIIIQPISYRHLFLG
jgi:hypothetical protein